MMGLFGKRDTQVTEAPFTPEATPVPASENEAGAQEAGPVWKFIKNLNTREPIVFKDGTTFVFPSSLFVTTNAELAVKLQEVAARYNIVQ